MIKLINFAETYLPGFADGFGWVVPALVGFMVGLIIWKVREKSLN